MGPTIEDYVRSILTQLPEPVRHRAMLGGGALRAYFDGTPVKDYDLFFPSRDDYMNATTHMRQAAVCVVHEATEHPTFYLGDHLVPFNLVGFRYAENIVELSESFDFTCCQMAARMLHDEVLVYIPQQARLDALAKHLRVANHQYVERMERREAHYVTDYGYTSFITLDDRALALVSPTGPISSGG